MIIIIAATLVVLEQYLEIQNENPKILLLIKWVRIKLKLN